MDFEAAQAEHAALKADKTVQQLITNYGFTDASAREAVAAVGPDANAAVNWLLDHGEEDRGGAVALIHCPHMDRLATPALLDPAQLKLDTTCTCGCPGNEVWLCLFCGDVRCSRYQKGCMVRHAEDTRAAAEHRPFGHHLVISLQDLSVWCYVCEAYVDPTSGSKPVLAPLVRRVEWLKHGGGADDQPAAAEVDRVAVGDALVAPLAAVHGSRGDAAWAPPRVAAVANALARPGYRTCAAHEYADSSDVLRAKAKLLAQMLTQAKAAVAYTGAGISTAAGIADYATKTGAAGDREAQEGKIDVFNPTASPYDALPTQAHHILVRLHTAGRLAKWVQQNHDGLPQKAGFPQACLNEIHGAWFDPSNPVVDMDGTLREDLLEQLLEWEESADLCLALGSTLCGMNADRIASSVAQRQRGGQGQGLVIVNLQQTQFDHFCALRIFARIDDVMQLVADELQLPEKAAAPATAMARSAFRGGSGTFQMPAEFDLAFPAAGAPAAFEGVDVFEVAYPKGMRGPQMTRLDLQAGAVLRIVRQPKWDAERVGSVVKVLGRTHSGDWELEFPGGVKRRLGAWWVRAALAGDVDSIPVTSDEPE